MPREASAVPAPHDAPRVGLLFRDLEVRERTRRGDGRRILRGAHAAIPPATMTAILGPSGSGKTTLLRVLCGREASQGLGNILSRVATLHALEDAGVGALERHVSVGAQASVGHHERAQLRGEGQGIEAG